jgi:histidine triad (HIT) family protein
MSIRIGSSFSLRRPQDGADQSPKAINPAPATNKNPASAGFFVALAPSLAVPMALACSLPRLYPDKATRKGRRMIENGCIFCAIAARDLPARIVLETAELICFFPREPELLGHTLIASRAHHADVRDCPASLGASLFEVSQRLAGAYAARIGSTGFNLLCASGADAEQSVPHLHFHFLPRFADDQVSTWPSLPPFAADLDGLHKLLKI